MTNKQTMMLLPNHIKKVFITGGAGFIGSHVVDTLLGNGYQVTVFDNLSTGKKYWIEEHLDNDNFKFIQGDILNLDHLEKSVKGNNLVWHLAANTNIPKGFTHTSIDLENNVIGTYNVLESMRLNNIQPILFSSTGAIYGDLCKINSVTENVGPVLPVSLYGASKIGCESFISAYCSLFNLRAWIFRFGNVIGKHMERGVIYDFIKKLNKNPVELEILGDGKQEKNYFLVEECIDGMIYALKNAKLSNEKPCDIFNLGTDSITKVTTIAQLIIDEMELENVNIYFTGGEVGWKGDQPQVHILSNKMHELGWYTKNTSDEAVKIAIGRLLKENE